MFTCARSCSFLLSIFTKFYSPSFHNRQYSREATTQTTTTTNDKVDVINLLSASMFSAEIFINSEGCVADDDDGMRESSLFCILRGSSQSLECHQTQPRTERRKIEEG